jgi:hypothetical protein
MTAKAQAFYMLIPQAFYPPNTDMEEIDYGHFAVGTNVLKRNKHNNNLL